MANAATTALNDQFDAATTDAARVQAQIARHARIPLRHDTAPHPWIAQQIRALITALTAGTARLCPHATGAPAVLHAAAWAPGHLTCSLCVSDLHPDPAEDQTCDRCRRPAHPIYPGMARVGPLLLTYGLCRRCAHRTGLGHPAPAPRTPHRP
jgi:hypothetical protein